jgi:hypothetical protein
MAIKNPKKNKNLLLEKELIDRISRGVAHLCQQQADKILDISSNTPPDVSPAELLKLVQLLEKVLELKERQAQENQQKKVKLNYLALLKYLRKKCEHAE